MSLLGEKTILAIDPGKSKCGLAVVHRTETGKVELIHKGIFNTDNIATIAEETKSTHPYDLIVIGSGTTSRNTVEKVRALMPSVGILVVDEKNTTVEARERYWVHNPRRGLRRLIPATLQTPPVPVDDYAALILAERVLLAQ